MKEVFVIKKYRFSSWDYVLIFEGTEVYYKSPVARTYYSTYDEAKKLIEGFSNGIYNIEKLFVKE